MSRPYRPPGGGSSPASFVNARGGRSGPAGSLSLHRRPSYIGEMIIIFAILALIAVVAATACLSGRQMR